MDVKCGIGEVTHGKIKLGSKVMDRGLYVVPLAREPDGRLLLDDVSKTVKAGMTSDDVASTLLV